LPDNRGVPENLLPNLVECLVQLGDLLRFEVATVAAECLPCPADWFRHPGIIPGRNNTGYALPRFAVLALSEPIIGPAANLQEFKNKVNFEGVVPAKNGHKGKFAVLLEPLDGKAIEPPTPVGGWSQAAHRQFANSLDLG
jgi:hypothetical protein